MLRPLAPARVSSIFSNVCGGGLRRKNFEKFAHNSGVSVAKRPFRPSLPYTVHIWDTRD
jgi:hypothetical protein